WEIYHGRQTTGASLRRLTGTAGTGVTLRSGRFKTINSSFSSNLEQVLTESSRWLAQTCLDIQNSVFDTLDNPVQPRPPTESGIHKGWRPTNLQCQALLLRL